MCINTTESRFSLNRSFKLVILTGYIISRKGKLLFGSVSFCKFYASVLFVHVVYKKLEMFFRIKKDKNIINIPSVYNRFALNLLYTEINSFDSKLVNYRR